MTIRINDSLLAEINAVRASRGLEGISAGNVGDYTPGDVVVVPDERSDSVPAPVPPSVDLYELACLVGEALAELNEFDSWLGEVFGSPYVGLLRSRVRTVIEILNGCPHSGPVDPSPGNDEVLRLIGRLRGTLGDVASDVDSCFGYLGKLSRISRKPSESKEAGGNQSVEEKGASQ